MRYMANSRLADGTTPEQVTKFLDDNGFSAESWDLVRQRVVTEYALKVGDIPGVVLFLDVDSRDQAADVVNGLFAVQQGLITFDLEPLGKTMRL
jgi:hypothetical protein